MNISNHFILMARYNQRMNNQLISALNEVDEKVLLSDKGAFFHSILGTMNHIMVGDLLWLRRFFNHQTHHRGQVTTLLNQMGVDVGATDFLLEIPMLKE